MILENIFQKTANEVESEWQMGGLSEGLYYEFALEVAERYLQAINTNASNKPLKCENHSTEPVCSICNGSHFDFECPHNSITK